MEFLSAAYSIVAIVFMFVFMFIGIWSFIVYLKSYRQKRYQNYILEKIYDKLSKISEHLSSYGDNKDYSYLMGEEDFDLNNEENNSEKVNNITDFNKQEKFNK